MMGALHDFLVNQPVGLLFLVVGIGYLVGKIRIGGFDVGPVSGVLFIYSVGLQAGPPSASSIMKRATPFRRSATRQPTLSRTFC